MAAILNTREVALAKLALEAGITNPKELANFMGQCSAETSRLTSVNESFRYTKGIDQVRAVVSSTKKVPAADLELARQAALNDSPEKLADYMYGNRMGNTQVGDGYKYRGRGYIQLTGKENYQAFGGLIGVDLVNNPDLALDPDEAAKIAIQYWKTRVPENVKEDVKKATYAINGGENGLEKRIEQAQRWVNILTPERIAAIRDGKEIGAEVGAYDASISKFLVAAIKTHLTELKTEKTDLTADIKVVKGQKKVILELGEHLKSHSFDNLKDVQKLDALAKTAGIELVTPAEAILADKKNINYTNKADVTALQNVLFERGLITSPSRGIFGAQTKNALIKEFDLPQNHTFGNELAAEYLEKLNPKTIEAIQEKVDLALSKVHKNLTTLENKMIVIDQSITALEAKRIALNDPTIETQQALKVADVESPDLAQLQDDLVLKEMFIAELEQRIANLTALTAQVPDQQIENIEKPDLKIDLLEVENKEILLTMTATGMSFNINGKDHDASYFNQLQVGITDTQSTYRNETNTLLAKYEYESDQFSIFHKNAYAVDKIAVISDFSEQNTINLVSFDAVKTQSLEKQKSLGKEC